jgi:hypothetical protein
VFHQQYHSIQAKGEDVENVLRAVEASEEAGPQEEDEEMTHETEVEQSVEEQLDETKASKENGRSGESQVGSPVVFCPPLGDPLGLDRLIVT